MSSAIRFAPLGGLGEIGMNCMLLEHGGDGVVIDCGVMFPHVEQGVDVIIPDFTHLLERGSSVRAVLVTHGHEDHIGALPYLLRELDVPVHAPPYALGLIRERLAEHGLADRARLFPTRPRTPFRVGSMEVEPIRVTHSIADATALVVRTGGGTVLHTGDFKIDEEPSDGQPFDLERFAQVGREGVELLLSDSTNSDNPGSAGSEVEVARALERIVRDCRGRAIVAIFSSNVHRLRALLHVARATGRQLVCLGRSARTHLRIATELGYLPDAPELLVAPDQAAVVPRHRLLVVASGTQAEPNSALTKLSAGEHPALALEPGDVVVLSARAIPGNERQILSMIDGLERHGATVRFSVTDRDVHVSGHGGRAEQRTVLELASPRAFVPVHGNYHHLVRHAALAREVGVPDVLVVENGALVESGPERGLRSIGAVPAGRVPIDDGVRIAESVLRDRALLGLAGVAVGVVVVRSDGRLARDAIVLLRGVVAAADEAAAIEEARRSIHASLDQRAKSSPQLRADPEELREVVRRALRRALRRTGPRQLATLAVVLEASDW